MWPKRKRRRQTPLLCLIFFLFILFYLALFLLPETWYTTACCSRNNPLDLTFLCGSSGAFLQHFPCFTSLLIGRSDQNAGWDVAAGEARMEESCQQVWQKGLGSDSHRNIPPEEDLEGRKRPFWYIREWCFWSESGPFPVPASISSIDSGGRLTTAYGAEPLLSSP